MFTCFSNFDTCIRSRNLICSWDLSDLPIWTWDLRLDLRLGLWDLRLDLRLGLWDLGLDLRLGHKDLGLDLRLDVRDLQTALQIIAYISDNCLCLHFKYYLHFQYFCISSSNCLHFKYNLHFVCIGSWHRAYEPPVFSHSLKFVLVCPYKSPFRAALFRRVELGRCRVDEQRAWSVEECLMAWGYSIMETISLHMKAYIVRTIYYPMKFKNKTDCMAKLRRQDCLAIESRIDVQID